MSGLRKPVTAGTRAPNLGTLTLLIPRNRNPQPQEQRSPAMARAIRAVTAH